MHRRTIKLPTVPISGRAILVALLLFAQSITFNICARAESPANPRFHQSARIRVVWGGAELKKWTGTLESTVGPLSELRLLGREPDTAGSIYLRGGKVVVDQPRPRRVDGFDIAAPISEGKLVLQLQSGSVRSSDIELSLNDLSEGARSFLLDGGTTTVTFSRVPGHKLRFEFEQDSLLVPPAQELRFEVRPGTDLLGSPDDEQSFRLGDELHVEVRALSGEKVAGETYKANGEQGQISVRIAAPEEQGGYRVRVLLIEPPKQSPYNLGLFSHKADRIIAERSFEFAVINEKAVRLPDFEHWETTLEIDPTNPGWSRRLPDWVYVRRRWSLPRGPIGNRAARTVTHEGKQMVQLLPTGKEVGDWQAYPLTTSKPYQPHVVEIDVPAGVEQQLVARVFAPRETGKLMPIGHGAVFHQTNSVDESESSVVTHRYLFWPQSASSTLVLQATGGAPSLFGAIRLRTTTAVETTALSSVRKRKIAANIENEWWVSDMVGANRNMPHDYAHFFQAAKQLCDWAELSGYNRLFVPATAAGGSLLPFDANQSPPLFVGTGFRDGMIDIPRCDPIAILLSVAKQRDIEVVPVLRFEGANLRLENQLRDGENSVELVDYAGEPWVKRFPRTQVARRYNILNASVQAEFRRTVLQLLNRYRARPSFGGVAIDLSGDSSIVPAGPYFGLGGSVLTDFSNAVGATNVERSQWQADPASALQDRTRFEQWIEYRSTSTNAFLKTLLHDAQRANAEFIPLTHKMFDDAEFVDRLRPSVGGAPRVDPWITSHGLAPAISDFRVQRSYVGNSSRVESVVDYMGGFLADADVGYQQRRANRVDFSAQQMKVRLPQASEQLPFDPASSEALPVVFDRAVYERQVVEAVAIRDPFMMQSHWYNVPAAVVPGRGARVQFASLSVATQPTDIAQQPFWARAIETSAGTLLLAMNASPFAARPKLTFESSVASTGRDAEGSSRFTVGRHIWAPTLEPFSIAVLQFDKSGIKLEGINSSSPSEYLDSLEQQVADLEQRDLNASLPRQIVQNSSMELLDQQGSALGWEVVGGNAGSLSVDSSRSVSGDRSLQIATANTRVGVVSSPFENPATGQLAVSVKLAVVQADADCQFVISVRNRTGSYRRRTTVDGAKLLANASEHDWNQYTLGLEDVPVIDRDELMLQFELIGRADIRLDDVELHALVFPLNLYAESQQQQLALASLIRAARKRLDEGQVSSCQAILDSYWSQFMRTHLPTIEPVAPVAEQTPTESAEDTETTPRVTERIRSWMPGFWR